MQLRRDIWAESFFVVAENDNFYIKLQKTCILKKLLVFLDSCVIMNFVKHHVNIVTTCIKF